jgi:AcrR family transcriptional regulator
MIEATGFDRSSRDRILTMARERFMSEGIAGVSIDSLAKELTISKKTFYKFFESKEDLLGQIVERVMQEMDLGFQTILSGDDTFVRKLNSVMLFIGRRLSTMLRPFLVDLQRESPHLWKRVQEFRRARMTANFQNLFLEGIRGGFVRGDVSTRVLVLSFIGSVEAVMIPSVLANESFSGDEAMRSILRIFFHGILTEDASRQLQAIQQTPSSSTP